VAGISHSNIGLHDDDAVTHEDDAMMTVTGVTMISKMTMRLGYDDDERDSEMTMFAVI
jgi:hypothetical protein